MPKQTKNTPNITKEFGKFWKRLDHHQQTSMLATGIISLSLILGVSITTQSEILTLKSQAYNPQRAASRQQVRQNLKQAPKNNRPIAVATKAPTEPPVEENNHCPGGWWDSFGNSCANNCAYVNNPEEVMCLDVLTEGCNCPTNQCWNGKSCVQTVVKKPVIKPSIEVPPPMYLEEQTKFQEEIIR